MDPREETLEDSGEDPTDPVLAVTASSEHWGTQIPALIEREYTKGPPSSGEMQCDRQTRGSFGLSSYNIILLFYG